MLTDENPEVWAALESVRNKNHWPAWCYCPIEAARDVLRELSAKNPNAQAPLVAALAAWRQTQGVYVFDPAL